MATPSAKFSRHKNTEGWAAWRDYYNRYRTSRRARQRELVNKLKANPCIDCGNTFPPVCMDFDHRDGASKITDVSGMIDNTCSDKKLLAEVAKCDLVCANCHRIRTESRRLAASVAA